MAFDDKVRDMQVIQQTLREVAKLEEDQQRALLRRFREVRQELRDRLDVLPSDTFTAQQTRGVIIQVEAAIEQIRQSLQNGIKEAIDISAVLGADHLIREVETFSEEFTGAVVPIDINTALIGTDVSNFLFNRHEASIDAYSADLRATLAGGISNMALQEIPRDTMIRKLSQFFIGEEWKLRRLVRTELHNAYNMGKLRGMEETKRDFIPTLQKTLIHPEDHRTGDDSRLADGLAPKQPSKIRLVVSRQIVDINKPFRLVYSRMLEDGTTRKDVREFMNPPDRPNDRSVMIPYSKEWDNSAA